MSDLQCPYCGADQDVNHDDGRGYDGDVRHEQECRNCGKVFVFKTYISYSYVPHLADCLNGADHILQFRRSWPHKRSRMGCRDCGYVRQATEDELLTNAARSA